MWNPIPGWSQTLHATDPGNWYVTANMPAGNTAVVSFPNTGQSTTTMDPPRWLLLDLLVVFREYEPGERDRRRGSLDIWLNNWGNEVMIQHDIVNRGTCPVAATATFGGSGGVPVQNWNLCQFGTELIWQLAGTASSPAAWTSSRCSPGWSATGTCRRGPG